MGTTVVIVGTSATPFENMYDRVRVSSVSTTVLLDSMLEYYTIRQIVTLELQHGVLNSQPPKSLPAFKRRIYPA